MGTRGLYVFKYNGIYYIFYNHYDSYPSALGESIVKDIMEIINNNIFDTVKESIKKIPLTKEENNGDNAYVSIIDASSSPLYYTYHTSDLEPNTNIFIEYVYIIDFDENVFVVKQNEFNNNRYKTFNLFSIPKNWINLIYTDDEVIQNKINDDIEMSDSDTKEDTILKIKLLETNSKIYRMKLKLNKM
jgi:hypothetical protein